MIIAFEQVNFWDACLEFFDLIAWFFGSLFSSLGTAVNMASNAFTQLTAVTYYLPGVIGGAILAVFSVMLVRFLLLK